MTQIAVKLPDDLVAQIDSLVEQGAYRNRSAMIREALEAMVAAEERLKVDGAFVAGYQARPETQEELAEAERLAIGAIQDEPWEKWW